MWKPGPLLRLVHAELVQALVQVAGQPGGLPGSSSRTSIPTLRVSRYPDTSKAIGPAAAAASRKASTMSGTTSVGVEPRKASVR